MRRRISTLIFHQGIKRSGYRKNNPAVFLTVLFALISFHPGVYSQNHFRNNRKDLESKKKRINDEIREINSMLSETKTSKKNSIGELVRINIRLEKRQELIGTIRAQVNSIDREIIRNEEEIGTLRKNLDNLKKEYARMIVFAQRNQDAYSVMMFVFASESFSQAYARMKYMQQYSEFRRKQAIEIIDTQTQLLAKLRTLKEQREQKGMLLGAEEKEKKLLSGEKSEKERALTQLQSKEKQLKSELEKKRRDAVELQLAIKRLIEAEIKRKAEEARKAAEARRIAAQKAKEEKARREKANRAKTEKEKTGNNAVSKKEEEEEESKMVELSEESIALSNDFSNNRGKLPWPVTRGVICEKYGEHEHPAIKGFMMFNNGVEICATKGMQARAVFAGEVTGIALSPTGGKLVIIRHGEYYSVYSNLEDVLVKTGQKVSVKQTIGTVQYDEYEDKTSMNLQIWKGQKTMDPGGWLANGR